MMRFFDLVVIAFRSVRQNRLHSVLMITALAIGTAATIFVISAGNAAQTALRTQLETLGVAGGIVYPTRTAVNAGVELSGEDAAAVMAHVDAAGAVAPLITGYGSYQLKNWQGSVVICGTDHRTLGIWKPKLLHGRFLNSNDVELSNHVVVIDKDFAEKHYNRSNIVGKTLSLSVDGSYLDFQIIGVIESQNSGINLIAGGSIPSIVYLPYTAAQKLDSSISIGQLLIEHPDAAANAADYLSRIHRKAGAFTSENISGMKEKFDRAISISTRFMALVAGISMLVAGLGMMTTMLSGATQRRREIGILMAVGATEREIAEEFLMESLLIAVFGGTLGTFAAKIGFALLGQATAVVIRPQLSVVISVLGAAAICGIVFAMIPAMRAARLDPVEALTER